MSKPTGGPAFPGEYKKNFQASGSAYGQSKSDLQGFYQGMTLRDYFAAHAPFTQADAIQFAEASNTEITGPEMIQIMVYLRYKYADAMLAERNKGE